MYRGSFVERWINRWQFRERTTSSSSSSFFIHHAIAAYPTYWSVISNRYPRLYEYAVCTVTISNSFNQLLLYGISIGNARENELEYYELYHVISTIITIMHTCNCWNRNIFILSRRKSLTNTTHLSDMRFMRTNVCHTNVSMIGFKYLVTIAMEQYAHAAAV